ncbi:MAG: gamma-glutamyltransferase [Pseudomonadota bacterium]
MTALPLWAAAGAPVKEESGASKAAVATAHPVATAAAFETLEAGGNAFDAAVAVTATLAVVEPYGSGLGGGGFWLLAGDETPAVMVDGRETAPAEADHDLYLDEEGERLEGASMNGPLAAGIPGTPAALVHITREHGRLGLAENLRPAIRAAREGVPVTPTYHRLAGFRRDALAASGDAAAIFLDNGEVPDVGHRITQPALADLLERLADEGAAAFYEGDFAETLVEGVRAEGGIWMPEDLADYRVVEREPIRSEYDGWTLTAAAPPSSGGVVLAQTLNILSGYDLEGADEADRLHYVVEALRRTYRDRNAHLGDPDHVAMPLETLLDPAYAAGQRATIHPGRATDSAALPPVVDAGGGPSTTHFSLLDTEGNRVAATLSINYPFGSGFMPPGTGVLLNNEMDDFAAEPGRPNAYGLVQGEANAVGAGRRPLSSMTPTFLEKADRLAILGSPGGSRIITTVLQAAFGVMDGDGASTIAERGRFHHQYLPDVIEHEPAAIPASVREELAERGHVLEEVRPFGDLQLVVRRGEVLEAASDPRGEGKAEVRPVLVAPATAD